MLRDLRHKGAAKIKMTAGRMEKKYCSKVIVKSKGRQSWTGPKAASAVGKQPAAGDVPLMLVPGDDC